VISAPAGRTGRPHRPVDRMAEILGYAVLADQLGLDVFALGEHHSADFFTSSPAVVLAAAAARTAAIRLTSATTLLGVADPVRVYEDFASLDLISRGRAEITVGRSAFVEPFELLATTPLTTTRCSPRSSPCSWISVRGSG
jgi:alkanesulfonate monooxygenase SsuD/methylene tetrahydromethanopterin reductase-like flavin-dependent oxidoreductase (luciferase family)